MGTLAILPIKRFAEAKQRLAEELEPGPRRVLVEAMCSDALIALRRATLVDEVVVVTDDPAAIRLAAGYGVNVLVAADQGHNPAASLGIARALELELDRALLVPGDCPLLAPSQLDELIARPVAPRSVVIVPDRHGTGTNALLLTPPDVILPSFGPGSRDRHVAAARSAGAVPWVLTVPSLALDVDTPEDLATLESELGVTHGGAANTRGLLRRLVRSVG
jgi:2-phospho-L-lactate guanylyltransferase